MTNLGRTTDGSGRRRVLMASFGADSGLHLVCIGHVRSEPRDVQQQQLPLLPVPVMGTVQRSSANATTNTSTMRTPSRRNTLNARACPAALGTRQHNTSHPTRCRLRARGGRRRNPRPHPLTICARLVHCRIGNKTCETHVRPHHPLHLRLPRHRTYYRHRSHRYWQRARPQRTIPMAMSLMRAIGL